METMKYILVKMKDGQHMMLFPDGNVWCTHSDAATLTEDALDKTAYDYDTVYRILKDTL
jgi:hypothetical protein